MSNTKLPTFLLCCVGSFQRTVGEFLLFTIQQTEEPRKGVFGLLFLLELH